MALYEVATLGRQEGQAERSVGGDDLTGALHVFWRHSGSGLPGLIW